MVGTVTSNSVPELATLVAAIAGNPDAVDAVLRWIHPFIARYCRDHLDPTNTLDRKPLRNSHPQVLTMLRRVARQLTMAARPRGGRGPGRKRGPRTARRNHRS
jgi:hypothetical protein